MIYFLEHDTAGNITNVCADPFATITPLVNRVTFNDDKGQPLKDANGNDLSTAGYMLVAPIAITVETYNLLQAAVKANPELGLSQYTCDPITGVVSPVASPLSPPVGSPPTT